MLKLNGILLAIFFTAPLGAMSLEFYQLLACRYEWAPTDTCGKFASTAIFANPEQFRPIASQR